MDSFRVVHLPACLFYYVCMCRFSGLVVFFLLTECFFEPGLDNALRVFGVHKDVTMNMELSQGTVVYRHVSALNVAPPRLCAATNCIIISCRFVIEEI